MAVEFLFGSFWLFAAVDLMRGWMNTRVAKVDPDAGLGTQVGIFGQQRNFRKFFLQVFVDDRGLVDDPIGIDQNRNLGVRVEPEKVLRLVLEIDLNEIVREAFLCQDNPSPVRVRSRKT
jgi:hypothetical protein